MTEREERARALEETGRALTAARAGFDEAADEDLLAYYLYETHALEARYAYLLKRQREDGRG